MATKKKFTPEEIKNLKANPYTLRVTEDTISVTAMRDRRKFCVIDVPRQYENLRLSQE